MMVINLQEFKIKKEIKKYGYVNILKEMYYSEVKRRKYEKRV
jgi:hypothetical protein